jgi:2-dehydro-3-deoxyglucarate aldolase
MNDSLKKKLRKNVVTVGSWITIGHAAIAEIMAKIGFDWLVIDMEHSAITLHEAQQLIQVIDLCGVTPLVRVGENNPYLIKRVMDAGSYGVMVPMVNTKEDAIKAVNAVKYPPVGTRGVGLARAQGYGMDFERYNNRLNRDSVVIVQIEHIKAVENLDDILSVDGVDAFFVGPYDLSGSLGIPGQLKHPKVIKSLEKVMRVAGRHNVIPGFHVVQPDIEEVAMKIRRGYKFIGYCLDTLFLGSKCAEDVSAIRRKIGK